MRFRVEQIFLTDDAGRVIPSPGRTPQFHVLEATSVESVLTSFVQDHGGGEFVGDILKFPGFQAIATVKKEQAVYTLQVLPVSDRFRPQSLS